MAEVVVSSKYQIVLPREIRNLLGIKKGQRLHIIAEEGGIRLVPARPLNELRGFLKGMEAGVERDEEDRL